MRAEFSKPVVIALGFGIGMLAAFLGIGGGVLVIPLLIFGFGLSQRRAAGTSLGVISVVVGTSLAYQLLFVDDRAQPAWLAAACIMPTALLAATVAASWARYVPQRLLQYAFVVILLSAAYRLSGIGQAEVSSSFFTYESLAWPEICVLPAFGLLVGTVSALVGIGGGMLLIPGLGLLFGDLTPLVCRATSLLVVFPTALVGFVRHRQHGGADTRFVMLLAPGCAAGALAGSGLVNRYAADWFPKAFAAFLVLAALRILLSRAPSDDEAESEAKVGEGADSCEEKASS